MSHSHKLDTTKGVGTAPSFLQCDQDLFVTEMHTFRDLLAGLYMPCPCGMSMHPYSILKVRTVYVYNVSSRTICTDAVVAILCEALNKVHSSPEYRGQSKRCTEIYHNLNMIRDSITENKTITCVTEFAVSMVGSILSISHQFTSTVETKFSIGKKSLQMWKTFHNYTISESFKSNWTTCFDYLKLTGLLGAALVIQHTARVMLETFLENAISTIETTDDVPDLTPEEDNAVRFASGFIIRSLKKKLSKSETYVYTLNCMHESDSDIETDNFLDYTKEWVSRINRGGLFRVSDETFLLF